MIIGPIVQKEVERCKNIYLGGFEGERKKKLTHSKIRYKATLFFSALYYIIRYVLPKFQHFLQLFLSEQLLLSHRLGDTY